MTTLREAIAEWLHQPCVERDLEEARRFPGMAQTIHGIDSHYAEADVALGVFADYLRSDEATQTAVFHPTGSLFAWQEADDEDWRVLRRVVAAGLDALADAITKEGNDEPA